MRRRLAQGFGQSTSRGKKEECLLLSLKFREGGGSAQEDALEAEWKKGENMRITARSALFEKARNAWPISGLFNEKTFGPGADFASHTEAAFAHAGEFRP